MAEMHELGIVAHLSAEAIGQPGQRRFRLTAVSEVGESAAIWMEKEELAALAEAIENVLKDQGFDYAPIPPDDVQPDEAFPLNADIEFRVGQMSMGVDPEARSIVVTCIEGRTPDEPDAEGVSLSFGYRRGYELQQLIKGVVAAGRQPCPLCTAPMDPGGHVCVRTNGHHPH
jgi:uncharacterized repeat protein (TIGR03847 family)